MSECPQALVSAIDRAESGGQISPIFHVLPHCGTEKDGVDYSNQVFPNQLEEWPVFGQPISRTFFCDDTDRNADEDNCRIPAIGSMILPSHMRVRFLSTNDETPNANPQLVDPKYALGRFTSPATGDRTRTNQGYVTDTNVVGDTADGKLSDFIADFGRLDLTSDKAEHPGVFLDFTQGGQTWDSASVSTDGQCAEGANSSDFETDAWNDDGKLIRSLISCGSTFYPSFTAVDPQFRKKDGRWDKLYSGKIWQVDNIAPFSDAGFCWSPKPKGEVGRTWSPATVAQRLKGSGIPSINDDGAWGAFYDGPTSINSGSSGNEANAASRGFFTGDCLVTKDQQANSRRTLDNKNAQGARHFPRPSGYPDFTGDNTIYSDTGQVRGCMVDVAQEDQGYYSQVSNAYEYGCTNKLSGSLHSVQVDYLAPDDGRPVDKNTWLAYFCASNQYQLTYGNVRLQRWRPGSDACNEIMIPFCLSNNVSGNTKFFDEACSCIRETNKLKNYFAGVRDAPIHCFVSNCSATNPNVYRTDAQRRPCTAKLCQQTIDLDGQNLLANGVQELKCFNETYKVEAPIDEGSQVTVPIVPKATVKPSSKQTHGTAQFSPLFWIAVALAISAVFLVGLYIWQRRKYAAKTQEVNDNGRRDPVYAE